MVEIEFDERKLAYKLLFITINDYLDGKKVDNSNKEIAVKWLFNSDYKSEVSFSDVCKILFIDHNKLKFMLNDYKDRKKVWIKEVELEKLLMICRK